MILKSEFNVTVEQPKFSELEETVIDTIESFSDTEETIQQDMNVKLLKLMKILKFSSQF